MPAFLKFLKTDAASGVLLMIAGVLAMIAENTAFAPYYDMFLHAHLTVKIENFGLDKSLLHWINDGLMAIFFLYVGLEIKREILQGELSSLQKASLPVIAALGGVIMPALIYSYINWGNAVAMKGWAVPVATDIAFAVGVFALLGNRVPRELKILLLSLAIIDDLVAIIIIALFYTDHLSLSALGMSAVAMLFAVILNRMGVKRIAPYILVGIVMWFCVLKSGVHATLAGVFLAMAIPMEGNQSQDLTRRSQDNISPVKHLQHMLHPWVSLMIMPIFAFANAGIPLHGLKLSNLGESIPLGIILGLFFGKQIGVFTFIYVGEKLKLCKKPDAVSWAHIYGLALLTGIGFTMSFFIGALAFSNDVLVLSEVRAGVLVASGLSAFFGYVFLYMLSLKKKG